MIPMTIAAPDELLPVRALEAGGTHWFFGGFTQASLKQFLESTGTSPENRDAMLAADAVRDLPDGVESRPSEEVLLSLSPESRLAIYRMLARFPRNSNQLTFIALGSLDERFRDSGISDATRELFMRLSCVHGNHRVLSGLACLLARTPEYAEKIRIMKALTMQKTMLLRMWVSPESDLNELTSYWGRGHWAMDVKALLASVSRVPGGTWMSFLKMLPPGPTAQLYSYPIADNPLNGPIQVRDCHWTSFNFFRDQPDPKFSQVDNVRDQVKEEYVPVTGDPRYGDILFFALPTGAIIHSAVYIADDVVFTKNGDTSIHPWMLATIPDLVAHYSFQASEGGKLTLSYFRNKSF